MYIGGRILLLLLPSMIPDIKAVTPLNPCDPMRMNVSVESILSGEIKASMLKYHIHSSWFVEPLRYVNCSRRGLVTLPGTIPQNVEYLDLSSNIINQVYEKELKKFVDLKVLWLQSNCIGDVSETQFYCKTTGSYERNAFQSLINLKLLDLGGNAFNYMPIDLPSSLEYLDISRSGVKKITKMDLGRLKNLFVFIADNMCFYQNCKSIFSIDSNAFEGLSIKLMKISENTNVLHNLEYLNLSAIICINAAQIQFVSIQPHNMQNLTSVERLDLYLQNPNQNRRLKVYNNSFDALLYFEHLDLSCNMIEYLPNDIFGYNFQLTYLDVSGNCLLYTIADPTYVPIETQFLYLGYNECNLHNTLNNSKIRRTISFGPAFSRMKNLTELSFAKPKRLGIADLRPAQMGIHIVNNDSFFHLLLIRNLSSIALGGKYVHQVDMRILSCMTALTYIDLSRNIIDNISVSNAPCLTGLSKSTRQRQFSECTTEVKLILSYNMLDHARFNYFIHPTVTMIDLSFNHISTIHDKAFKNMPCVKFIDLRNNPIVFIHVKSFLNAINLKTL